MSLTSCCSQYKRKHDELHSSDTDEESEDSSYSPDSPPSLKRESKRKTQSSLVGLKVPFQANIESLHYPVVKFKLSCPHPYQKLKTLKSSTPIQKESSTPIRKQSMIGQLTKQFEKLIKSRGGHISVSDAAETMRVTRRRLYDVLHVLEGAGIVRRDISMDCRTAIIKWLPLSPSYQKELWEKDFQKLRKLKGEEKQLDKWIEGLSTRPTKNIAFMYAARQDLFIHNHRKDHVDLIISSPRGSQLQYIGGSSLRIISCPPDSGRSSKAFVLEDDGELQTLDHLTQPTPLLARCSSDFTVQALRAS